jgi:hypothetical protein
MPSNRRRSVAALVVAFLLVTLVAPPAQADGRGETRWTFWWSWFVTGTSGFAARTFGYSGAVDPDGRVTTPPVPPEEAATLRYRLPSRRRHLLPGSQARTSSEPRLGETYLLWRELRLDSRKRKRLAVSRGPRESRRWNPRVHHSKIRSVSWAAPC